MGGGKHTCIYAAFTWSLTRISFIATGPTTPQRSLASLEVLERGGKQLSVFGGFSGDPPFFFFLLPSYFFLNFLVGKRRRKKEREKKKIPSHTRITAQSMLHYYIATPAREDPARIRAQELRPRF